MLKVSVVVPTYRSGDGLDRLVASLDAQTLPASEFEVVFVDDGSPDDTHARLLAIQHDRTNVRVERIENSGWPSRPRNIGTDLATGEYVAYMDHDDELYPDALRAAYELAQAHGADVVNGKEARTHDASWAIDTYRQDAAQSIGRTDQHPLIPMNPHKLYRRAFLDEHGIRFREGGRVMWEDIFFNLLVDRHAKTISTLASVPYYHWFMTPGSGSKGFLRSGEEFWHWLREVLVATQDVLEGDAFTLPREQLLAHQYRTRVLGSFDGRFAGRPQPQRDHIYRHTRELQTDFGLDRLDDRLNSSGRIRAALLRADERALLEQVPRHDPGIPGWGRVTAMRWVDGRLELEVHAEWSSPQGRRHALRRAGERIVKVLPAEFDAVLPSGVLDVTDEVEGAAVEVGIRSRASRITWMVTTESDLTVADATDGTVSFDATARAKLDPGTVVFGRPLEPGLWDLNVRATLAGSPTQQRMRSTLAPSAVFAADGVRVAYTNADGGLTLALGMAEEAVRRLQPDAPRARLVPNGGGHRAVVPLLGISPAGGGDTAVRVAAAPEAGAVARLRERFAKSSSFRDADAFLRVDDDRVVLDIDLPAGWSSASVRVGDQHPEGRRWWTVTDRGIAPGPKPRRHGPTIAQRAVRRARRAMGAVRRRLR